jgi:hypothetical protein
VGRGCRADGRAFDDRRGARGRFSMGRGPVLMMGRRTLAHRRRRKRVIDVRDDRSHAHSASIPLGY